MTNRTPTVAEATVPERASSWLLVGGALAVLWVPYGLGVLFQDAYYACGPYVSPFYLPVLWVDPTVPGVPPVRRALLGLEPQSMGWLTSGVAGGLCAGLWALHVSGPGARTLLAQRFSVDSDRLRVPNTVLGWSCVPFLLCLYQGTAGAFFFEGRPGLGVGSVVLLGSAVALTRATSETLRAAPHVTGRRASLSLGGLLIADAYVRLLSIGALPDLNTWAGVTWAGGF